MLIRTLPALFLLTFIPACLDSDDKGGEDDPFGDLDVAKDDSFQRPTEHGALAYNVAATSALSRTARFHAWEFDVLLPGQTPTAIALGPEIGGGPTVDTVVYLYKQQAS